jgi:hypothetical protein
MKSSTVSAGPGGSPRHRVWVPESRSSVLNYKFAREAIRQCRGGPSPGAFGGQTGSPGSRSCGQHPQVGPAPPSARPPGGRPLGWRVGRPHGPQRQPGLPRDLNHGGHLEVGAVGDDHLPAGVQRPHLLYTGQLLQQRQVTGAGGAAGVRDQPGLLQRARRGGSHPTHSAAGRQVPGAGGGQSVAGIAGAFRGPVAMRTRTCGSTATKRPAAPRGGGRCRQ